METQWKKVNNGKKSEASTKKGHTWGVGEGTERTGAGMGWGRVSGGRGEGGEGEGGGGEWSGVRGGRL